MKQFFNDEFLPWLDSFLNFEKLPQKNIFWLDMMESLCRVFGNPEKAVKCFHIAGSKGKGSTAAFIASILNAHGKKVSLYASPHLKDFRERISSPEGFFPQETYDQAARILMEGIKGLEGNEIPEGRAITWFELVTVFAFLVTKLSGADFGVYEVGLGGRLDATNVLLPEISVINTIELEHTEFLGDTLEKIAGEKAGIMKPGRPVISSPQEECVRNVFREKAQETGCRLYFEDELVKDLSFDYVKEGENLRMKVCFDSKLFSRKIQAKLSLLGKFQAQNAALASLAVKLAVPEITEEEIEKGLEGTSIPARFQQVKNLVIDGAHTGKSISGTMETFNSIFKGKAHLLFACAADKKVEEIAPLFKNRFEKITLTRPGFTKIYDKEKLFKAFEDAGLEYVWEENPEKAIENAVRDSEKSGATLLVTGSFYLAGIVPDYSR